MSGKSTKAETPEFWETEADKIECRCGMVYVRPKHSTPEEAAKEEVIAAAEVARERFEPLMYPPEDPTRKLCDAVDSLRAIRQPKGVKPEELKPGQMFRHDLGNDEVGDVCIVMQHEHTDGRFMYRHIVGEHKDLVCGFHRSDLVIPIDPEDS